MSNILDEHLIPQYQNSKDFQPYRDFHNVEEAKAFGALLKEKGIPFSLEGSDTIIDSAIVGRGLIPKAILKIPASDFERVNQIIEEQLKSISFEDVKDHYLNQLDTEELLDIFKQPDEWTVEDTQIARVILNERGIEISSEEIAAQRQERFEAIRAGKKGTTFWMYFYFLAVALGLFISPFFIIAGIGMGYYYAYGRAVDPDGQKYYVYEPNTRLIGRIILYGGTAVFIGILIWLFIGGS